MHARFSSLSLSLSLSVALALGSFFILAAPLAEASYLPGQTLDPSCLPTDPTCVVTSLTASSTANSFPYYAANGSVLSATSTLTIASTGVTNATSFTAGNIYAPVQIQNLYRLRSTITKIAAMKTNAPSQLRVAVWGDSVAEFHAGPFANTLVSALGSNGYFGCSGSDATGQGAGCITVNSTSGSTTPVDGGVANGGVGYNYDYTRFPTGVGYAISPGGCVVYGAGGGAISANKMSLLYVTEPDSGTLTMSTNNGSGFVTGPSVNAASGSMAGGVLATTSPSVGSYTMKACASGAGPVYVWGALFENLLSNGVIVMHVDRGGLSMDQMETPSTAVTTPWYAAMNPDLVTFEMFEADPEPDGSSLTSRMNTYVTNWKAANPLADFMFIGTSPQSSGDAASVAINQIYRSTATTNNALYWDGHDLSLNYATEKALGWITDSSTPHQTLLGQAAEANLFWSDMGFGSLINSTTTLPVSNSYTKTNSLEVYSPFSGSSEGEKIFFNSANVPSIGPGASITSSTWNAPGLVFYPSRNLVGYGFSFDSTTGTQRMYIDGANGHVGIGSSTPNALLAVQGQGSGTGVTFQTTDSGQVPKFTILDNGSVGIGTTSPGSLLSLGSIANFTTATSTFYGNGLNLSNGCFAVNGVCVGNGGSGTVNSGTTGQLAYYAGNGTAVSGTSNIIISGGNVGIGTTSPYAPLSVVGNLVVRNGSLTVSGDAAHAFQNFAIQSATGNDIFGFQILGTGLNGRDWRLEQGRGTPGSIGFNDCSNTCNPTLTIGTNDNVGIATSTPQSLLTVAGNATIGFDYSKAGPTNGLAVEGNVGIGTTTPYARLTVWGSDTASTTSFLVANSASTTVFAVYNNGNATYSGSIFQSSDRGLKTNIAPLEASSSLAAILGLTPVSYTRLDQPEGGTNLGFLAQDVEQIFPELVSTTSPTALTPNGTLTLNYIGLIAPIVEAIKELAGHVGDLAKSITTAVLNATTVHTQNLCLGSTCVTESQLKILLQNSGQQGDAQTASAITITDMSTSTPSCTLSASPTSVTPGDHVVLSWNFPEAGTFSIDQNIGSVSPALAGTTTSKAIDADTTFTGTAVSATGATATCTASVSVTSTPPPPLDLSTSTPPVVTPDVATSTATTTPPEATSTPSTYPEATSNDTAATSTTSIASTTSTGT